MSASSEKLDELGMVCDFTILKEVLNKVVDELDHKYLNDLEPFKSVNPTSENLARYIFEDVSRARPDFNIKKVTVWETETSSASYTTQ